MNYAFVLLFKTAILLSVCSYLTGEDEAIITINDIFDPGNLSPGHGADSEGLPVCPILDDEGIFTNFPHPADCHKYYRCAGGQLTLRCCRKGEQFNPDTQMCDVPHHEMCGPFSSEEDSCSEPIGTEEPRNAQGGATDYADVTTAGTTPSGTTPSDTEPQTPTSEETTPTPEEPTPTPEEPTPTPEEPTPLPEEPTPTPEEPTPLPEEPTPLPEEPTPLPEEPTPTPEEPTPLPEKPTPTPEEPTPTPEEPTPTSEEPTPAPEEPTLTPEKPTPTPEKPTPTPELEDSTSTTEPTTTTPEPTTTTQEESTPSLEPSPPTEDSTTPSDSTPPPNESTTARSCHVYQPCTCSWIPIEGLSGDPPPDGYECLTVVERCECRLDRLGTTTAATTAATTTEPTTAATTEPTTIDGEATAVGGSRYLSEAGSSGDKTASECRIYSQCICSWYDFSNMTVSPIAPEGQTCVVDQEDCVCHLEPSASTTSLGASPSEGISTPESTHSPTLSTSQTTNTCPTVPANCHAKRSIETAGYLKSMVQFLREKFLV